MNISSTRDAVQFSLNPVFVIATPTLTNICAHAYIHTHTHIQAHIQPYIYTQFVFGWKLTLNCSIQGTKILLSHPKKWQVAISHHVVLPRGGKKGEQSEEAECKQAWRYWGYVLTPSHHPSPMPYGRLHLFRKTNFQAEHTPFLSPWNQRYYNLQREYVVPHQRTFTDEEKILKSQQAS